MGTVFVEHRLSAAARAFEAQALVAAGLHPMVDRCESFVVADSLPGPEAPNAHSRRVADLHAVGAETIAAYRVP